MRRKDYLTTVIGTLIIIFAIGFIVGIFCGKAHGMVVSDEDLMTTIDRSLIEGGAMPCVASETAPSEATVEEVEETAVERHHYSVNGQILAPELQDYLFRQLESRNIGWFYEISLCQIYQESRFNCSAVNLAHMDFGLCQHYQGSFPTSAKEAGLVEYDIMNPIDSIYVYAYLMSKYISITGDVYMALSMYYTGAPVYSAIYVNDVTKWFSTIRTED